MVARLACHVVPPPHPPRRGMYGAIFVSNVRMGVLRSRNIKGGKWQWALHPQKRNIMLRKIGSDMLKQ